MTESEFMQKLDAGLQALTFRKREEILDEMRQHYAEGRAIGRDEHELSDMLGNPGELARDYLQQSGIDPSYHPAERSAAGKFFVALALCFFNMVFILGPLMGIWGAWFGLAASGISMTIGGALGFLFVVLSPIIPFVASPGSYFFLYISTTILCASLGILLSYGSWALMRKMGKVTAKYIRWNQHVISGRRARR